MSDYQKITIKAIERGAVTIEVVENVSSRALSSIFDAGDRRGIEDDNERATPEDWVKIGAMLLFGEKAMSGDVEAPDDGAPEPDHFVANVTKLEATPIGEGDSDNPIYRALLRVDLKNAKHAELFAVGESFGAVADLGGDFEDVFG